MKLLLHLLAIRLILLLSMIVMINSHIFHENSEHVKNNVKKSEYIELFERMRRTVAAKSKDRLWDKGVIPFTINNIFSGYQRKLIKEAMREWEKSTCITFVETVPEGNSKYLAITKASCGCCLLIEPFFENKVMLSLADGCDKFAIVLHELGHAIGLEHEHIRPDRDMFIEVIYENIPEEFFGEFEKGSPYDIQTFNQTYDYYSVMHYPSDAFSLYWPLETLIPKQDNLSLGVNIKLSEGDISTVNMLYRCSKGGGIFYGISGSFGLSTHSNNSIQINNCEWRIKASMGERIELVIPTLSIFETPNCTDEFLEIRTGYPPHSTVLGRYCRNFSPIRIKSSNILFVTYMRATTSNPSISFTAYYNIICDGIFDIKLDTPFNLESTNFPDAYPPNRRCNWQFIAPDNHRIVMKIHYFELELNESCVDFLMVKDGIDYNSKIIGVYCGRRDSWRINSTDNKLLVIFSSDKIINYSGFSATLFAIPLDE